MDKEAHKKSLKVSVIIPIYNAEIHLEQCIHSILNQSLQEIEIICIDDGSLDSSLRIIEDYAKRDHRIIVLKQENKYAGAARNYGMSKANGKYCIFLDADDFFDRTMLEDLYDTCEKNDADICICRGRIYDETQKSFSIANHFLDINLIPKEYAVFNRDDIPDKILNFTSPAPWTKMFRLAFIQNERLEFQELQRTNDLYFTSMALVLANKITTTSRILVNYRKGHSSSLQATNTKSPFDFDTALSYLKEELKKRKILKQVKRSFINFSLGVCLYNLYASKSKEAYIIIWKRLKSEIFKDLGLLRHHDSYYYSQKSYEQMKLIMDTSVQHIPYENIPEQASQNEVLSDFVLDDSLKVSIIIPVYNVEQYIEECVSSAMFQTLKDIEIICVNDGSLDHSMEIVERLKEKDDRILIVNKKNGGLSSARNAGMNAARGEFILFLDSDDYLMEYAAEHLYRQAKYHHLEELFYSADVFYDSTELFSNYSQFHKYYERKSSQSKILTGKEILIQMTEHLDFKPSACLQLFQREFLTKHHIEFYEGILHEDNLFTLQCLTLAKRTKFINEPLYLRRIRTDSIMTSQKGWNNAFGYYVTVREMMNFIETHSLTSENRFLDSLFEQLSSLCIAAAHLLDEIEEEERTAYIRNLDMKDRILFSLLIFPLGNCEKRRIAAARNARILRLKLATERKRAQKRNIIKRAVLWLPRKILHLLKRK